MRKKVTNRIYTPQELDDVRYCRNCGHKLKRITHSKEYDMKTGIGIDQYLRLVCLHCNHNEDNHIDMIFKKLASDGMYELVKDYK